MHWNLSEEQDAYQATFRQWLESVASSAKVREWFDADDASIFEDRLVSDGWTGVGLPEDLGGQGGGLVELALTAEELARAAAPSGAWLATVLSAPMLGARSELVEAALAGETVAVLMSAEDVPDSAPGITVDADGRLSGSVPRVLAGDTAKRFIAVVDEGDSKAMRLVEATSDGVAVTPRRLLDRSRSVADVRLDAVPSEELDVDTGDALVLASARAAVLVAADSLGATERMLDLAVEYSKQRHQFGVPIGSFQAVKHAAATILVGIEAARSVVYFAAASVDAEEPQSSLHAAAAKAQVTAEGVRAADSALTMHGAIGYTWEHDLHLFYKRARLDEQLFGAPKAWNERLADELVLA